MARRSGSLQFDLSGYWLCRTLILLAYAAASVGLPVGRGHAGSNPGCRCGDGVSDSGGCCCEKSQRRLAERPAACCDSAPRRSCCATSPPAASARPPMRRVPAALRKIRSSRRRNPGSAARRTPAVRRSGMPPPPPVSPAGAATPGRARSRRAAFPRIPRWPAATAAANPSPASSLIPTRVCSHRQRTCCFARSGRPRRNPRPPFCPTARSLLRLLLRKCPSSDATGGSVRQGSDCPAADP